MRRICSKQTYRTIARPARPRSADDVSAWSLGMQFGVKTDFARTPRRFPDGQARRHAEVRDQRKQRAARGVSQRLDRDGGESPLKSGAKVSLTSPRRAACRDLWRQDRPVEQSRRRLDVRPDGNTPAKTLLATTLNAPRVGIYQSYDPRWMRAGRAGARSLSVRLYETAQRGHQARRRARLRASSSPTNPALNGLTTKPSSNTIAAARRRRLKALRQFVADGGTLISLGEASNLLVDKPPLE